MEKGKCRNTVCPLYRGKPQYRGQTVANGPLKDRPLKGEGVKQQKEVLLSRRISCK